MRLVIANKYVYWALISVTLSLFLLMPGTIHAATITIVNNDGPNEGFNDPAPFTPIGGNNANTRGQARVNVFQAAADILGNALESDITIRVSAQFNSMGGSPTGAILGSAGPQTFVKDFSGALIPATWYPIALANSLAGTDLNASSPEIIANFNSDVDNSNVLGSINWYYGLNGNAAGHIDLLTVVLHEVSHGLGFTDLISLSTGAFPSGTPDIYSRNLVHDTNSTAGGLTNLADMTDQQRLTAIKSVNRLLWDGANVTSHAAGNVTNGLGIGGRVQLYAPSSIQPGSSVAHYSTALSPNEIMEPSYISPNSTVELTVALFEDLGWIGSSVATGCDCNDPDAILGDEGNNVIDGTPGDDIICGFGGNDTIRGFGGNDCVDGGDGDDTLYGKAGKDKLHGGEGSDMLIGNGGQDILFGGPGDDILRGNRRKDTLNGGADTDNLHGGAGADTCSNGEINTSC